jgi:hypothetical protein
VVVVVEEEEEEEQQQAMQVEYLRQEVQGGGVPDMNEVRQQLRAQR